MLFFQIKGKAHALKRARRIPLSSYPCSSFTQPAKKYNFRHFAIDSWSNSLSNAEEVLHLAREVFGEILEPCAR